MIDAISAVFDIDAAPMLKLVLIALADNANADWHAWPSLVEICRKTGLSRRAVNYQIVKAVELKLIRDTGDRRGKTSQVVVYDLKGCTSCKLARRASLHLGSRKLAPRALVTIRESSDHSLSQQNGAIDHSMTTEQRKPKDLQELVSYASTIDVSADDAEAFFDSQQAGGWSRSGKAIKDWRAALRTWKRYGYLASQKRQRFAQNSNSDRPQREMSAFEITTRIKAIDDELGKTEFKKTELAIAERRRALFKKRSELRSALTGVTA